jgi:hypothetical protein
MHERGDLVAVILGKGRAVISWIAFWTPAAGTISGRSEPQEIAQRSLSARSGRASKQDPAFGLQLLPVRRLICLLFDLTSSATRTRRRDFVASSRKPRDAAHQRLPSSGRIKPVARPSPGNKGRASVVKRRLRLRPHRRGEVRPIFDTLVPRRALTPLLMSDKVC